MCAQVCRYFKKETEKVNPKTNLTTSIQIDCGRIQQFISKVIIN